VAEPEDMLELDEVWSFVLKKSEKRWLWTAMCRRTRQIIAYVIGDRSEATCLKLWQAIPDMYKHCQTYHMERWNNTLRQWNASYVRKTLSFSKSDFYHELVTRLFIVRYNLNKLSLIA
jgi:insertion element IS1 protein InsB